MSELSPAEKHPEVMVELFAALNYAWIGGTLGILLVIILGLPVWFALPVMTGASFPVLYWKNKKLREIHHASNN